MTSLEALEEVVVDFQRQVIGEAVEMLSEPELEPEPPRPTYVRITSGYMGHAYVSPEQQIEQARAALRGCAFDTLVGTGLSGALLVPRLAEAFGCHWLLVRKPKHEERSHAHEIAEGNLGRAWVFVDDFISGGATCRRVVEAVEELAERYLIDTECVGGYLYRDGEYRRPESLPGINRNYEVEDELA